MAPIVETEFEIPRANVRQATIRLLSGALALFSSLAMLGCETTMNNLVLTHQMAEVFDEEGFVKAMRPGPNEISGEAVIRTQGGGVKTCAGLPATIVPVLPYTTERIVAAYDDEQGGFRPSNFGALIFSPDSERYKALVRSVTCDAQGRFDFGMLADGDYYVETSVAWLGVKADLTLLAVSAGPFGGMLAQRVHVAGGDAKRVVLSGS